MCVLLGACVQLPVTRQDTTLTQRESLWQERQATLAGYLKWDLAGRLAVRAGDQAASVTIIWRRRDRSSRIDLIGAFGGGRVTITEESHGASLQKSSDRPVTGPTAEAVLYQALGWQLPFNTDEAYSKARIGQIETGALLASMAAGVRSQTLTSTQPCSVSKQPNEMSNSSLHHEPPPLGEEYLNTVQR